MSDLVDLRIGQYGDMEESEEKYERLTAELFAQVLQEALRLSGWFTEIGLTLRNVVSIEDGAPTDVPGHPDYVPIHKERVLQVLEMMHLAERLSAATDLWLVMKDTLEPSSDLIERLFWALPDDTQRALLSRLVAAHASREALRREP